MGLRIKVNGERVGAGVTVAVGERLDLEVKSSDKKRVDHPKWQVSGASVLKNFVMREDKTREELVTGWNALSLSVCPLASGQGEISVEGSVGGTRMYATVKLAITKPKVISFTGETDIVTAGIVDGDFGDQFYLTFGGLKERMKPGILWTAKVIGAGTGGGSYGFVQVMKINRKKSLKMTIVENLSSDGEWVLDEDVFYGTSEVASVDDEVIPVTSLDQEPPDFVDAPLAYEMTMLQGEDSPATPLFNKMPKEERFRFDQIKVDERFKTHLMYRPHTDASSQSLWISLACLSWYWKATADFDGKDWIVSGESWAVDPVAEKVIDLPTWKGNRRDIMRY